MAEHRRGDRAPRWNQRESRQSNGGGYEAEITEDEYEEVHGERQRQRRRVRVDSKVEREPSRAFKGARYKGSKVNNEDKLGDEENYPTQDYPRQDVRPHDQTQPDKQQRKRWGDELAKLIQEGKVHEYIEEFRRLQTLVGGWSEETLVGTFIKGLKSWLAREVKLRQPQRLTETMQMAEILEDSIHSERKPFKENTGSNFPKSPQTEREKEEKDERSKKKSTKEVQKLSGEELQERIKKGICFKCGEPWGQGHRCKKSRQVFVIAAPSDDEDEELSDEGELKTAGMGESEIEA